MLIDFFTIFFLLVVGHFVADYPLQGDFLAKAKNANNPIPGVPWWQAMIAHSGIHAGMVYFVTGFLFLAIFEWIMHFIIDNSKCDGIMTYNQDQFAHIFCKFAIALFYIMLI
jgi:hypothetical protein